MVKIGLSSYSLSRAIAAGEFDVFGAIEWVAENGGEHMEISPGRVIKTNGDPAHCAAIRQCAEKCGIELSSYTIGANFIQETEAAYQEEIARVKTEVDTANFLGVKRMRHDAGNHADSSFANYERHLPKVAAACREIADYAQAYGIVTSVENHGFLFQGSERVQRLLREVGRDNFRTTLDIGNFLCADEDPLSATMNNLPFASHVHFKDFYVRDAMPESEGFFKSAHGKFLRGAIVGHGDVDTAAVVRAVKAFGYNGFVSVEFEGMEECKLGSRLGMAILRKLFNAA